MNGYDDDEVKRQIAERIAVTSGALRRCEAHLLAIDVGADPEPAYKLANTLISQNDDSVAIFQGKRRELTDLIKSVIDESGEECYSCQKILDSDD